MAQQEVIYSALDANGVDGLWVSNGTAAGTQELTGISGAATAAPYGLDAFGFTAFDGEVLFDGADASGNYGLWVTNGTAAGTFELTGISGARIGGAVAGSSGPNSLPGLVPHGLTVFNSEVLFSGVDAGGNSGLWVTNGTAAGTHELTGISGARTGTGGFQPYDLAVLNGEVLLGASDASGGENLWVTDGTVAGTHELTGISGAGSSFGTFSPEQMTAFNGEALFRGSDPSGYGGLWVTNGTAAGTHELTGIGGANSSDFHPAAFTVFNDEMLFSANDASGNTGVWVTNGTAAGTQELTGISGAYAGAGGLDPGDAPFDDSGTQPDAFTILNGDALFSGRDASGGFGLWVTNGTAAGTHELTGISGANAGGLNPEDLTVLNNEVLFRGLDANGNIGLWVTNGTVAGTSELPGVSGADTSLAPASTVRFMTAFSGATVPTVTAISEQPSTGDLGAGATVAITLDFSEAVTVAGTPTVTLNDGATATYAGGSGSGALVFSDTVAASDANVAALAATAINLNGGTIADSSGNNASLSLTGLTQAGPQIDTDANFVQQVYQAVLLRPADAGGLSAWTGALESGSVTRSQVVADFVGSAEAQDFVLPVARLYQTFFDRAPDPGGLDTWVNALRNGVSINTIAGDFIGSPEFAQHYPNLTPTGFVTALYQNVLGRAPDSAGDAAWVNFLDAGNDSTPTQAAAALGFSNSPEFIGDSTGAIDVWLTAAGSTGSYPATITYPSAQSQAVFGQSIAASAPAQSAGASVTSASDASQASASQQFLAQAQHT